MPFTFSTETFTRPLADFGKDSAQMILQTGATIQQGLQQMMTNRQVQGLGQELGTLNPESPEWAQQAVQLGSRYPMAMKAPAGQFMLSTQAKAHAQWKQGQLATQQMEAATRRQMGMENMRQGNRVAMENMRQSGRGNQGVDLLSGAMPVQKTPASGISFGAGMPSLDGGAAPQSGSEVLTSGTGQAMEAQPALPMEDPLMERAFSPLQKAQRATMSAELPRGVKPTPAQIFSRVAQEDSQMQQEKRAAEKAEKDAVTATAKEQETLRKEANKDAKDAQKTQLETKKAAITLRVPGVRNRIKAIRTKLEKFIDKDIESSAMDSGALAYKTKGTLKAHQEYFKKKSELEAELQAAGQEEQALLSQLEGLAGEEKKLDVPGAAALMKEAGGDKEKARALARERGFTF